MHKQRIGFDWSVEGEPAPTKYSGHEAKTISSRSLATIWAATGAQALTAGENRSRTKSFTSSFAAITHIAGPGSSLIAQQARLRTVWVFDDWAEHRTAMSLNPLSANTSINSFTQGDESARHRPGIGDVLSTAM